MAAGGLAAPPKLNEGVGVAAGAGAAGFAPKEKPPEGAVAAGVEFVPPPPKEKPPEFSVVLAAAAPKRPPLAGLLPPPKLNPDILEIYTIHLPYLSSVDLQPVTRLFIL